MADVAWSTFAGNIRFFTNIISILSQIFLSVQTAIDMGDPTFALLSLLAPIHYLFLADRSRGDPGDTREYNHIHTAELYLIRIPAYFSVCRNKDYSRRSAMKMMAQNEYRDDVYGSDLGAYIVNGTSSHCLLIPSLLMLCLTEFKECSDRCSHLSDTDAFVQYSSRKFHFWSIFTDFMSEIPMVSAGHPVQTEY